MSEYVPQAWRFGDGPNQYYANQYAQTTARLDFDLDYDEDRFEQHKAEFLADLAAHDRQVKAEALKTAASILPEATEGIDRVGTSNWTARDRDIYSLAIEEAAGALLFRADCIESQETP